MTAAVASASAPRLEVRGLQAWYGAAQVLFGLDFELRAGEVLALLGRNGAGKSTTLKAVMGLVERRGTLRWLGRDIARAAPHEIARAGLGWVPENRRIFTDLTVRENLEVGRQRPRAASDAPAPWTVERVVALFPNLGTMLDRSAAQMSGGEQQMLTVARTLMGQPRAVLLDEPSEGVAPVIVDQMADAVLAMKAQGVAVLLSEQNIGFAARVADRALLIERGEARHQAPMADVLADATLRRDYLGL